MTPLIRVARLLDSRVRGNDDSGISSIAELMSRVSANQRSDDDILASLLMCIEFMKRSGSGPIDASNNHQFNGI